VQVASGPNEASGRAQHVEAEFACRSRSHLCHLPARSSGAATEKQIIDQLLNGRLWHRRPDIRQKEAEAETRRQGSDPLRRKGENRANCLARRGPRPANFHPRPSREPAGSTIKFAQSKFKREMVVLKGCSASEAGTNPPRRSVDPIAIIHS
jgi:hypothetical protein